MENPDQHQQPSSISSNPNQQNSSEEDRDQLQVQTMSTTTTTATTATTVTAAAQSGTRLYECSFCKKGFSNAQALGGHMNIHRKDKAKLKQAARENNQRDVAGQRKMTSPLTISNPSSSVLREHEHHHHRHQLSYESQVALAELKQLPLFVETGDTYKSIEYYSTRDQDQPVINQGSFGAPELDLELRLGVNEPHTKPAVALGTRKFF